MKNKNKKVVRITLINNVNIENKKTKEIRKKQSILKIEYIDKSISFIDLKNSIDITDYIEIRLHVNKKTKASVIMEDINTLLKI